MPTITRTAERQEFLADIVTTAIEGGISSWARVTDYHWWSPTLEGGTAEHADGMPNAYATITESDDFGDGETFTITVDAIANAIGKALADPDLLGASNTRRLREANKENDAGEIDADDASALVEIFCFGKVTYC
jgi:hypothetical protein